MKRIKIVVGTYGYRKDSTSPIEAINKNSEPIEVEDAEAERLVGLGVAKYVDNTSESVIKGHLDVGQFDNWSIKELQKLAKDMGLKANGSKAELIARITAEEVEVPAEDDTDGEEPEGNTDGEASEGDDNEKPPVLDAADPEI